MTGKPELLAPCGNAEAFYAAVDAGADAVYLGMTAFSARRAAANFTDAELEKVVRYAHALGVRVHVALNTLVKESELDAFFGAAGKAYSLGADALIVQDVFLGSRLKERFPDIELHLSTQAGVSDARGAAEAVRRGFSRVILARETPLSDIRAAAKIVDTECFVQGALCSSFSGHCYLSGFAGGNSGNRGLCKQPCRKKYRLSPSADERERYAISLSDLSVGKRIGEYLESGVRSFKIEGRMRRPMYVAAAVRYYRAILDGADEGEIRRLLGELKREFNRGDYTLGVGFGDGPTVISDRVQGHIGEKIGEIGPDRRAGRVFVKSGHNPSVGDACKVLRGGEEVGACFVKSSENARWGFFAEPVGDVRKGDEVRLTTDAVLEKRLSSLPKRKEPISVSLFFQAGGRAKAVVNFRGKEMTIESDFVFPRAEKQGITEADARECFGKTDGLPLDLRLTFGKSDNVFAPKSLLNAFRRKVYGEILSVPRRFPDIQPDNESTMRCIIEPKTAVISERFDFSEIFAPDVCIFAPRDYSDPAEFERFFREAPRDAEKFLFIPALAGEKEFAIVGDRLAGFDGIYADGIGAMAFAKEKNVRVFCGLGLNLFCSADRGAAASEDAYFAYSKELTFSEIRAASGGRPEENEGFVFCLGSVTVMEPGFCPYKRDCAHCAAGDAATLTDEDGRVFPLRRYRLGGCRFEIYNECDVCAAVDAPRKLYCFNGWSAEKRRRVAEALAGNGDVREVVGKHNSGHLSRGVL